MIVYVVSDNEGHIYGVRFTKEEAETLKEKEQEKLEYQGSRLLVHITICISPLKESDINHLEWVYQRLSAIHGENENIDYMKKFREIINSLIP
jgi:hypothetical protein